MSESLVLKQGSIVPFGKTSFVLDEDTPVTFEGVESRDQLAEILAGTSAAIYGAHRDQFAHEESGVNVTYGVGGARQEEVIEAEPHGIEGVQLQDGDESTDDNLPLESLTVAKLRKIAAERGVELPPKAKKDAIIKALS